jgi:protease-4
MKQFFKFVLATVVGIIIASVIPLILIVGIIVAAGSDKEVNVDANSVLHVKFDYPINERTPNNPLANLGFLGLDGEKAVGLNDIYPALKKLKQIII